MLDLGFTLHRMKLLLDSLAPMVGMQVRHLLQQIVSKGQLALTTGQEPSPLCGHSAASGQLKGESRTTRPMLCSAGNASTVTAFPCLRTSAD